MQELIANGEQGAQPAVMPTPYVEVFDSHFREWAASACDEWGYPAPKVEFYQGVRKRLTDQTFEWIGYGIEAGLIQEEGLQFNLADNPAGKGPNKWFSQRSDVDEPQCNWEYYVQVAFFARLFQPCREATLGLSFEDDLMDLAVRAEGHLLWCIEVKEKAVQLDKLLAELESHGNGVDLDAPDRGNDPLRKAKYLVKHRPKFFSGVAIGMQRDFEVSYRGARAFKLLKAGPPLDALREPPPAGR